MSTVLFQPHYLWDASYLSEHGKQANGDDSEGQEEKVGLKK